MPRAVGTRVISRICTMVVPMGRLISASVPMRRRRAWFASTGMVTTVIRLLMAVRLTERATSPLAR
jgi:hypothetical protein